MKDNILNFLADNYLIFMIVAVILLFALIGFIVDGKKKKQKGGEVVPGASVPPQPAPAMEILEWHHKLILLHQLLL